MQKKRYFVTMVVNSVHTNLGVSQIYSLRKIVMRQKLDMAKDRKVQFGDYIKASKDADITNNMKSFTHKCIAVEPSENWQGSINCYDLIIGMLVSRCTVKAV